MKNDRIIDTREPRLPFVFLVDTSGSMMASIKNNPIEQVKAFLNSLPETFDVPYAPYVDLSVISFSHTAKVERDFMPITVQKEISLEAEGPSATGEAICLAYHNIKQQLRYYMERGIQCYRPVVLMLTDGMPTDNIDYATQEIVNGQNKKIRFVSMGITGCDEHTLSKLSSDYVIVNSDVIELQDVLLHIFKSLIYHNTKAQAYPKENDIEYTLPDGVKLSENISHQLFVHDGKQANGTPIEW